MSAALPVMPAVRTADLRDARECESIVGWLAGRAGATPFHVPAWSRAVEIGTGQRAHYLVADDARGRLAGLLPLTFVRSPLFGKALVSAGFGVGGGALSESPLVAEALQTAAWKLAQKLGATTLELRGGAEPASHFHTDRATYLGFVADLAADDAAQLAAIPRKQRAEVRKSFEQEFTISSGRGAVSRAAHYGVYAESVRNLGTPVFPRALFAAVLDAFGENADILTVSHAGAPVASVLSLYREDTVYPYWGGGTPAARGLRANDAMYFALMGHARDRGCEAFDFGRSKAGTGPAAFKRNWGFEGRPLAYHVRTADGAAPRAVNPLDPKYARKIAMWKRLPLPVANRIGPWIAKGLG